MDSVGQDSGWCLFNVCLDSSSRAAVDQGYFAIDDEKGRAVRVMEKSGHRASERWMDVWVKI